MKFSNRLLLFLAGVVFVFLGLLLTAETQRLVLLPTAGGLHLFLVSSSSYFGYFSASFAHTCLSFKGLLVFS